MMSDYAKAIIYWRDRAGSLDGSHPRPTIKTMLWACEQWCNQNADDLNSHLGQRITAIKAELHEWLEHYAAERVAPNYL